MALQVWLPLNGNVKNQGLANITTAASGLTSVSGKLGSGYRFDNGSQSGAGISINSNLLDILGSKNSIAVWVKPYGNHVHYNGTILSSGNWNSSCWAFGVSQDNTQVDLFGNHYNTYINCSVPVNTWTHLACINDGTTAYLYKNGEYVGSSAVSSISKSDATNTYVGRETYASGYFGFNGAIQDLRVYNHCLSPKEVKEISKGLVLHYKMDDGNVEPTTNLYNGGLGPRGCYNGTNGKYDFGSTTDFYYEDGIFQGRYCRKVYEGTSRSTNNFYASFGSIIHPSTNGGYKTLSFDLYPTQGSYLTFYTYNGSGTVTSVSNGIGGHGASVPIKINQWNHVEVTIKSTSSTTSGFEYAYFGEHTANNHYWLFANVQVEEKDHATPYTPTSRSETTVYDCSGFGYNGTVTSATAPILGSDSPRYNSCFNFNTMDKCITTAIDPSGYKDTYSIAWWGNITSFGGAMFWGFSNMMNWYDGKYWNQGDGGNNPFYSSGTTTITPPSINTWHHYVITGDGSATKLYVDGVLYGTAKTYRAIGGSSLQINGWPNDLNYRIPGMKMSDFRIYATPFSAEDVKELYNTSAIVCDNGTVMAYSLEE